VDCGTGLHTLGPYGPLPATTVPSGLGGMWLPCHTFGRHSAMFAGLRGDTPPQTATLHCPLPCRLPRVGTRPLAWPVGAWKEDTFRSWSIPAASTLLVGPRRAPVSTAHAVQGHGPSPEVPNPRITEHPRFLSPRVPSGVGWVPTGAEAEGAGHLKGLGIPGYAGGLGRMRGALHGP